jgi:hypothetical protein
VFGNRKRFEERERTEQIGFELTSRSLTGPAGGKFHGCLLASQSLYQRRPSMRRKTGKFIHHGLNE